MRYVYLLFLLIVSCTPRTIYEKPSIELARTAYAVHDSFDNARLDLAEQYSEQLLSFIIPPEQKILIKPIIVDNKRIAIIPDKYKEDNVVVVGTAEWDKILQTKTIANQLVEDNSNLSTQLEKIGSELRNQQEIRDALVARNNELEIQISEKNHTILRKNLYLISLLGIIAIGVYLRLKSFI